MKKKVKIEFDPFTGMDLTEKITKTLSDSLASEIDRQILRSLGYEIERNKIRINKIYNIFNKEE
jgi:hypothetical protein